MKVTTMTSYALVDDEGREFPTEWRAVEWLDPYAERFTCTEAEAIYELYELAGLEADWFMRAHAHGDSELEGDLHEETDDEKGWTYR